MMRCLIYIRIAMLLVLLVSQSAHANRKRRLGEHCSFFLANLQSAEDTASGKRPFYELIEKEPFEYRSEHFKTVEGVPSSALGPGLSKPDYLAHYYSHNQNGVPVEVSVRREKNYGTTTALDENKRLKEIAAINRVLKARGIQSTYIGWISSEKMLDQVRAAEEAFPIERSEVPFIGLTFLDLHDPDLFDVVPGKTIPTTLRKLSAESLDRIIQELKRIELAFNIEELYTRGVSVRVSAEGQVYLGHIDNIFRYRLTGEPSSFSWQEHIKFIEKIRDSK